jgi:uncharacterized protein (TIGR03435 family)
MACPALHAEQAPAFEVVSVKPSDPANTHRGISFAPGGRSVKITNLTVGGIIQRAWDLPWFRVFGGPSWINTQQYDIVAKAPGDTPVPMEQFAKMLQQLLSDRFALKTHLESKEFPVYALVVIKSGHKLQDGVKPGPNLSTSRGQVEAQKVPMSMFASAFSRYLDRAVVDETGLTGQYDFKLAWTPDETEKAAPPGENSASDPAGPSLFTAIQNQLGLKLESKKAMLDVLIIDNIEKASEN